ncbi:interferon-induced 35 kDa protein [Thalassophryne amazonica]|uniref:interferon-induced 35 kDa protein n=1 Tax=Thalassophryne amazonica TaxID=390379 RepID=UPI001471AB69|nr:interferon-induced 35 kDa protein [Thalassophryne amazonica]
MDSHKDFSKGTEETLEGIKNLITSYKGQCEQLLQDQMIEVARRDEVRKMTQEFNHRADKLSRSLRDDRLSYMEKFQAEKERLDSLRQDEKMLLREIESVEAALRDQDRMNNGLKLQSDIFTGMPERTVVFAGQTGVAADGSAFDVKPRVVYPMDGGTALITFEDKEVAKKVLDKKFHQVKFDLENACSIKVEAKPVHLMMPQQVEMVSQVCSQKILISNLPQVKSENVKMLLMELELHFSKRRNGGGEVDYCEMLPDSGSVVITFVDKNIARSLTDAKYHDVILQGKKHKLWVTPFLNGQIIKLETRMSMCPRTVLLAGIPDFMERDTLQDLMEIYFQNSNRGGGEIEMILYNTLGQKTLALFEGGAMSSATGGGRCRAQ